jgi:acyl-coenzyme A thioesterase PaaI-like protein
MSDASDGVDAEQRFGWAGGLISGSDSVELTPLRVQKRRVAQAVRRVVEALVGVDAEVELLEQVAADLESAADGLEQGPGAAPVGWAEAANAPNVGSFMDRSPVLGQANPVAPPLNLAVEGDRIIGTVRFGAAYEGPPSCVHGGWIAAAFDEVLGAAQSLSGSGGMTAYLKVDYRSPTPLHADLRFEGELERTDGRKIYTVGRLLHGDTLCAEAQAMFISIDFARFAAMRQAPSSE